MGKVVVMAGEGSVFRRCGWLAATHAGRGQPRQAKRSRAHPARQIGGPHRRRRTRLR